MMMMMIVVRKMRRRKIDGEAETCLQQGDLDFYVPERYFYN